MIKFLIVSFFVIMFIRLVAPFLIRFLLGFFIKKHIRNGSFGMPPQNPQQPQQPPRGFYKKPAGNLNVDYVPEDKNKKDFPGGEYVDYEEVK